MPFAIICGFIVEGFENFVTFGAFVFAYTCFPTRISSTMFCFTITVWITFVSMTSVAYLFTVCPFQQPKRCHASFANCWRLILLLNTHHEIDMWRIMFLLLRACLFVSKK